MWFQLLLNGIIAGSSYALIAIGFAIIYETSRFFHFAHGAVFTWGAYSCYLFAVVLGWPFAVAIPLAISLTTLLGVAIEGAIYRPLRHRGADSRVLFLASLGLFVLLGNVVALIFGDDAKILAASSGSVRLLGAMITPVQALSIGVSGLLLVATAVAGKYTGIGRTIRAAADDPELALASGLDVERLKLITAGAGSLLAAVAAILTSFDVSMTPTMGLSALLLGIVSVIGGGVGSVVGAALAGLFLGMFQQVVSWWIGAQWQDAGVFVALLLVLLFRPQGLLGRRIDVTRA